jgi:hypothetical protein
MPTLVSSPSQDLNECETLGGVDTIDSTGNTMLESVAAETTVPVPKKAPSARPESGCPRCGYQESWGAASWCPECGYYPAFDKQEENAAPAVDSDADEAPQSPWQEIPGWLWVLGIGCVAILIVTVAAQLLIPSGNPYKSLWMILQTVLGGITTLVAHVAAYLLAIQASDKYSPLDLIMKPVDLWRPTLAKLPRTRRRVCLVAWGATALFGALFILDAAWDLNALFEKDWADAQPQRNLLQEIVKEAKRERESEAGSLSDAMNQFVGDEPPVEEIPKIETDCLIIGFTKQDRGVGFSSILLAAVPPGGKLTFAGMLRQDEIPEEVRELLNERMPSLVRSKPFVHVSYDAVWLRPVLMCRVSHDSWTAGNQLQGAAFEKMLRDVNVDGR